MTYLRPSTGERGSRIYIPGSRTQRDNRPGQTGTAPQQCTPCRPYSTPTSCTAACPRTRPHTPRGNRAGLVPTATRGYTSATQGRHTQRHPALPPTSSARPLPWRRRGTNRRGGSLPSLGKPAPGATRPKTGNYPNASRGARRRPRHPWHRPRAGNRCPRCCRDCSGASPRAARTTLPELHLHPWAASTRTRGCRWAAARAAQSPPCGACGTARCSP